MKLAFCLFNYFPYGGLQRDFLRIARACQAHGHEIHIYTMRWEGEREPEFNYHILPTRGLSNHSKAASFANQLGKELQQTHYDAVIGFNKMPHLDIYYAADVCYQSRVLRNKSWLYRLSPRYRTWKKLEAAVFDQHQATEILLISPLQQKEYSDCYQTESSRFHLLPPGITPDRKAPANRLEKRAALRQQYHLTENDFILLMVGSGFKTKGVDRSLLALASLPNDLQVRCQLWVVGKDDPAKFMQLARENKIENRVRFFGGRKDVPDFLLLSDLLLHPSYHENTGTAILEAMIAGLPVLTTAACGYANYVIEANAGIVLPRPFKQTAFNQTLQTMLTSPKQNEWQQNGLAFAKRDDIYQLVPEAVKLIEQIGKHS